MTAATVEKGRSGAFLGPRDLLRLEQCSTAAACCARRPELWRELCRVTFATMYDSIIGVPHMTRPPKWTDRTCPPTTPLDFLDGAEIGLQRCWMTGWWEVPPPLVQ